MDPVTNNILQGRPYAGMGTNLERLGLQKVLKSIIEQGQYTVKFIIDYAVGLGYQKQMAKDVFEELTGLNPDLIVLNNEYYKNPAFVPSFTIAWGYSKNKKNEAHYIVPFEYGFGIMKKNEIDVPEPVQEFATVNEAVDFLKGKVTKVFTIDQIITKDLLESDKIQLNAISLHDVDNPYFSDPVRELKNRYKKKLITLQQAHDEMFKLAASQKITAEESKSLTDWYQKVKEEQEMNDEEEIEFTKFREDNVENLTEEMHYLKGGEDEELSFSDLMLLDKNDPKVVKYLSKEFSVKPETVKEFADRSETVEEIYWKMDSIADSYGYGWDQPNEEESEIEASKSKFNVGDETDKGIVVEGPTKMKLSKTPTYKVKNNDGKTSHYYEEELKRLKKKNFAGYSNNPDYFGDWFGKGQIDYSKIINPEDEGKIWMLKIWCGSGYILDVYLVKANDYQEAIDITFNWSYENEGKNKVIKDYEYLSKFCKEDYESEYFYGKGEGKPSDKISYEDFETEWFGDFVSDSYNELFAYSENFFIDELPEEYVNKKQSSKKKTAENMEDDKTTYVDSDLVQYHIEKFPSGKWYYWFNNPISKRREQVGPYSTEQEAREFLKKHHGDVDSNDVNENAFKDFFNWDSKKFSSSKIKAATEDITLEDIKEEEQKSPIDEATENALDENMEDVLNDQTPQDFFEEEIKENVTTKMSQKVSEIIESFVTRFDTFENYDISLNSYKVKTIEKGQDQEEDIVNDVEIDCEAILQVIININPVEDMSNIKKVLAVFSIDGNKVYWNGTVKAENNYFYAFAEEGLDALFKETEQKEEIIEDIV